MRINIRTFPRKSWLALSLWLVSMSTNTLSAYAAGSVTIRNIYVNEDKQFVVEFDNPAHITPAAPQVLDYPGEKHDIVLEFTNTSFAVEKVPRAKVVLDELTKTFPNINSIAYAASNDATRARIRLSVSKDVTTHPTLIKIDQDVAVVNLDLPPRASNEATKETASAPAAVAPVVASDTSTTTQPAPQTTAAPASSEEKQTTALTATSPAASTPKNGMAGKALHGIKGAWQSSLKAGSGQVSKFANLFGPKKQIALNEPSNPPEPSKQEAPAASTTNATTATASPDNVSATAPSTALSTAPLEPSAIAMVSPDKVSAAPPSIVPPTTAPLEPSAIATASPDKVSAAPPSVVPPTTAPLEPPATAAASPDKVSAAPLAVAPPVVPSVAPPITTPSTITAASTDNVVTATPSTASSTVPSRAATNPSTAVQPQTNAAPDNTSLPAPKPVPPALDNTDNTAATPTPVHPLKDVSLPTNIDEKKLDLPRIVVQPRETTENQPIKSDLITPLKPDEAKPEQKPATLIANSPEVAEPFTTKTIEGDPAVATDLKTGFSTTKSKESETAPQIASAVASDLTSNPPDKETRKIVTKVELKSMTAHSGGKDYFPPKTTTSQGTEPTYSEETLKHYNEAVRFHLAGKLPEAIAEYHAALAGNPRMEEAHSNLGLIFNQQNKYEQAMAEFHKALAINPKDAITYNGIGAAMRAQKNMLAAVKNWQTAISLDPNLASAHYNLGTAYELDKDLERALTEYKMAVKYDDKLGEAYYHMGLILQKMDNRPLAIEQFKQAVKVSAQADYSQDAKHRVNLLSQKKNINNM